MLKSPEGNPTAVEPLNQDTTNKLCILYNHYKNQGDEARKKACGRAISAVYKSRVHLKTASQASNLKDIGPFFWQVY